MEKGVVVSNISKQFNSAAALTDVSFSIKSGEFFSILGPSGCGKTSLLRILGGFETPDQGQIFLDGTDISRIPPNRRPVNTVFQNYSLFPHLSIWENIAFGLRIAKHPESFIRSEVERMLQLIQMTEHAQKEPDQISGGQKQRVAIARALVNRPSVLLLDEPLAALDLKLRQKMLLDLEAIHDEVGITFIFVTHDQTEAMAVSDRIAVLDRGRLAQIGTPVEIYETPKNRFVADFIGNTNFFDGFVSQFLDSEYLKLSVSEFSDLLCFKDKKLTMNDRVHLSVRPEKIHIAREKPQFHPRHNCFQGAVDQTVYKGDHTHFDVLIDGRKLTVIQQHSRFLLDETPIRWKDSVWIWWHADDGFMIESSKE